MNEIIERAARALDTSWRASCDFTPDVDVEISWQWFVPQVCVAIQAMREPTKAMVDAGRGADNGENGTLWERGVRECWQLMTDAALKVGSPMTPAQARKLRDI